MRFKINVDHHAFEVEIFLNDLEPKAVRVKLYADGINGGIPVRQEMKRVRQPTRRIGRLYLQGGFAWDPPTSGLYGATHTALRRRCDPTGKIPNPLAR
ncbi:MAG: hypothetical protein LJE96_02625 [Deltaproteobacteria bacterium]|nr:hypothetical protein [Deltaproteobacteria bacterium]